MKLKQRPEDFLVEEITDVVPSRNGLFAFYRLDKSGWATPDALAVIRQRLRVEVRRMSYGGLKDRHAQTTQYLTIFHGPRRNLRHDRIDLRYLGQVAEPYTSQSVRCNRFRLALRDLSAEQAKRTAQNLDHVSRGGVPNYFDDQRFGSVTGEGGEFIGRLIVRGQFEEALKLALAGPYEHDRAAQKEEKRLLLAHWGDWPTCMTVLPRSHARSLVDYLRLHPTDFRGAVARLRPELRGLYLSAYQSHLWNRMLARWLTGQVPAEALRLIRLRLGEVPVHVGHDEAAFDRLAALSLPLPTARLKLAADDPRAAAMLPVLAEEGLEMRDLRVKGIHDLFFSKGERAALCVPSGLTWEASADELNASREKVVTSFDLPRGCYATLIVKRVTTV